MMGDYNGTVPTFLAGELPDASKFAEITNFMLAATGAWTSYTPTTANLTIGNGTLTAQYRRLGKTLDFQIKFTFGSTSAVSGSPTFTFPAGMSVASFYGSNQDPVAWVLLTDAGTTNRGGFVLVDNVNQRLQVWCYTTTGTLTAINATTPQTWATGDIIALGGTIQLA